jgi:hypothetical protein
VWASLFLVFALAVLLALLMFRPSGKEGPRKTEPDIQNQIPD